jgi:hypothetical protein
MAQTVLYAGSTILSYGTTAVFAKSGTAEYIAASNWRQWYTLGGYWIYLGASTNSFPATVSMGSGTWISSTKGGSLNVGIMSGTAYTVSVSAGAGGTASGGGTALAGAAVAVSASPSAHYRFIQWSDGNASASRSVTATGDISLSASFEQSEWTMKAATESTAKGTVALTGWSSGAYFAPGALKTATATPKAGYRFTGWFRNGAAAPDYTSASAQLKSYAEDTTYTARFAGTARTVTAAATPAAAGSVSLYVNGAPRSSPAACQEGDAVVAEFAEAYNGVFSGWTVNGVYAGAARPLALALGQESAETVAVVAVASVKPARTLTVTVENGDKGSIALRRGATAVGSWSGGMASFSVTVYDGVAYTLSAAATNPALDMFARWSVAGAVVSDQAEWSFTPYADTAVTARFSERPSYTLSARASSGGAYVPGNAAEAAGCGASVATAPDFAGPDRWLAGNVRVLAAPANGWRVAGWQIANTDGGSGGTSSSGTHDTELVFALAFNAAVTFVFERFPSTVGAMLDFAPESGSYAARVTNTATGESGPQVSARFDDILEFFVEGPFGADSGVTFLGWHFQSVEDFAAMSEDNPWTDYHVSTVSTWCTARLGCSLQISAAHTAAADGTGSVSFADGLPGSSRAARAGRPAGIIASGTAGSIFQGWFLAADTLFADPLPGLGESAQYTVTRPAALVALFAGPSDIEERYLAAVNIDNASGQPDPALGALSVSGGGAQEITRAEWDAFTGGAVSNAPGAQEPGDRFYKFTGTRQASASASAAGGLGFMRWTLQHLIPVPGDPPPGEPRFTVSQPPETLGTAPSAQIVTSRHQILRAVWGDPVEVDVTLLYADGADASMGGFSLSPATPAASAVQGGVRDRYVQGSRAAAGAWASNGHVFLGWAYARDGSQPASPSPAFEFAVEASVVLYAVFAHDTDAIYRWEAGAGNKMLAWRSKRYVSTKPFNPSSARVYADGYPVTLNLYMCSSPAAPAPMEPSASIWATSQGARRIPTSRPEKYIEIEVLSQGDVLDVSVSTSMGGLSQ